VFDRDMMNRCCENGTFPELLKTLGHSKWNEADLAGSVQQDRHVQTSAATAGVVDTQQARPQAARAALINARDEERLLGQLFEWSKQQTKR